MWLLISDNLSKAFGVVNLVIFLTLLENDEIGTLSLVNTVIFFFTLLSFKIEKAIPRFFLFTNNKLTNKRYYSTIFNTLIILGILSSLIMFFFGFPIIKLLFINYEIIYEYLFFIIFLGNILILNNFFREVFIASAKSKYLAKLSLLELILIISFTLIFIVYLDMSVQGRLYALLIGGLISLGFKSYHCREYYSFMVLDMKILKSTLKYSLPIVPHSMGTILILHVDKIILENILSLNFDKRDTLENIGIYDISTKVANIFKSLVNSFASSFHSKYMNIASRCVIIADKYSLFVLNKTKLYFVILSFLVPFVGGLGVSILKGLDTLYFSLTLILSQAVLIRFYYTFLMNRLLFELKTSLVSTITISSSILNVILNFLLIPKYGIMGACYTTFISYLFNYIFFRILSPYNINSNIIAVVTVTTSIIFLIT